MTEDTTPVGGCACGHDKDDHTNIGCMAGWKRPRIGARCECKVQWSAVTAGEDTTARREALTAEISVESACVLMHNAYESAARQAGWETQAVSRKPWSEVPEANKATMRAAVTALFEHLRARASTQGVAPAEAMIDVTEHGIRPENSGEENSRNMQRLLDAQQPSHWPPGWLNPEPSAGAPPPIEEDECATTTAPATATTEAVPAPVSGAGSGSATERTVELPNGFREHFGLTGTYATSKTDSAEFQRSGGQGAQSSDWEDADVTDFLARDRAARGAHSSGHEFVAFFRHDRCYHPIGDTGLVCWEPRADPVHGPLKVKP